MKTVGWGYKTSWFAVRSESMHEVAEAIGLRNIAPSDWQSGVGRSYEAPQQGVIPAAFVTPSVDGWVLVHSRAYIDLC